MKIKNLSKTKFLYMIRNWKIVNQILFAQLAITFLLFSFLLAATLISQRIFEQYLKNSSNEVFVKETAWSLSTLGIYKYNFQEVLKSAETQIKLVNLLYFAVQNYKNFTTKAPLQCLNKPNTNDSYSYNSSSCYGLFGNVTAQSLKESQPSIDVTSLLTEFRASIDYTQALYFSQKSDAQFYTINVGFYFPKTFQPHIRPWYQFHVKNVNFSSQTVYGNPYKVLNNGIRVPSTMSLINLNKEFDGVIAKDVNFNTSELFKTTDQHSTLNLIKNDGTVVYSKLYANESQAMFTLTEEKYTGFNQTDLEQILAFHYAKPFVSNCLDFHKENLLCRFNSIANQSRIIQTANITGSPYIMLLFKDPTLLVQQNEEQIKLIQNEIQKLNNTTILTCCLTVVFIVIFSYIFVNIILQQLKDIIYFTNFKMINVISLKKNPLGDIKKEKCFHTRAVTNLCKSIFSLLHYLRPKGKCLECQFEEQKQYPQKSNDNCPFDYKILPGAIKKYSKYSLISINQRRSLISLIKNIKD